MLDGLLTELLQVKWHTSIEHKFNFWFCCFLAYLGLASLAYLARLAGLGAPKNSALQPLVGMTKRLSESLLVCAVLAFLSLLARRLLEARRSGTSKQARQMLTQAP